MEETVLTATTLATRTATHAATRCGCEATGAEALDALLKPASIALVGASRRPQTPGNTMALAVARDGYKGRVYAVNPKYDAVEGIPCYPDLASLPEQVEHVVLGVGDADVEEGLLAAIRHGAKAVTIFTSCAGAGEASVDLAGRIAGIAGNAGIAVCGGNSMGFCNPRIGLRVTGYASTKPMRPGNVAFITQSGSAFSALAYNDQRLKFSLCASSGREFTTTAADYVEWALNQPETRVIGLFLETARSPSTFARSLEKARHLGIPVIVLKVGCTAMSAAFAASHSGAIAGDDAAYEALFAKWGVIRVDTLDQLAANLLMFSSARPAASGGMASIHDSGGEREMVVDLAAKQGVPFAALCSETLERMRPHLDSGLQPENPLDVWGSGHDFERHVEACLSAMLDDPGTGVGVLFQDLRDDSYVAKGFADAAVAASRRSSKPVAIVTNYASADHRSLALATTEAGVPVIDGTEEGLCAIRNVLAFRDRGETTATFLPGVSAAIRQRWRDRLNDARSLDELESLSLLADYGLSVARARVIETLDEARAAAKEIGFPVALKTAAPGIDHKSDRGGVKLDIKEDALDAAYLDLSRRLGPGAIIAEMVPKGVEMAFGLVRDPAFGPYVMVASGGIWIEVFKDRVVALPPLSVEEAGAMLARLKTNPLLDGVRGAPAASRSAVAEALVRFSILAADLGDLIDEMDVNPVLVSAEGCVAVDAMVKHKPAQLRTHNSQGS